jgi:hypothetical protein
MNTDDLAYEARLDEKLHWEQDRQDREYDRDRELEQ